MQWTSNRDHLVEGQFYWVRFQSDPCAAADSESMPMPAQYIGLADDGYYSKWKVIGCEAADGWPTLCVSDRPIPLPKE